MCYKVGYYIRTDYGISKIVAVEEFPLWTWLKTDNNLGNMIIDDCHGFTVLPDCAEDIEYWKENTKEDLIDLIKPGDYVNGVEVTYVNKDTDTLHKFVNTTSAEFEKKTFYSNQIKTVVTKEQFKEAEYHV